MNYALDWMFQELWNTPKDKWEWNAILNKAKEINNKKIINNMIGNLIKTQSGVYAFNHNFQKHCKAEDFAIVNTSIEDLDAMYNEEKNCFVEAVNCSTETSRCVEIVAKSTEQEYIEYHKR